VGGGLDRGLVLLRLGCGWWIGQRPCVIEARLWMVDSGLVLLRLGCGWCIGQRPCVIDAS